MSALLLPARLVVVAVACLAATIGARLPAAATDSSAPAEALRILLTNDDGWNGGGLPALRDELLGAGFDVVVFAPADDQSGNSARMTFGEPVTITQEEDGVFSVGGSPADSAEAGLSLAFPGSTPDLVVSGPNPGNNIANASIHSGTIGAAATSINEGVPAIAVSTGMDPDSGEFDYAATNVFMVDLIEALVANAGDDGLLPDGVGLNVNVPFVADGAPPAGVAITTTDRSYIDLDYASTELPAVGASVEATAEFVLTPAADAASDAAAVEEGLVSITLITGNYDESESDVSTLTALLTSLL